MNLKPNLKKTYIWIRVQGLYFWWKKTGGGKSRATVPLKVVPREIKVSQKYCKLLGIGDQGAGYYFIYLFSFHLVLNIFPFRVITAKFKGTFWNKRWSAANKKICKISLLAQKICSALLFKRRLKGTVSPDYKCLEVISIKSPLLGHVTPDI